MNIKAEKIRRKVEDIETLTGLCVRRDSAKTVTATLKYALYVSSRELFCLVDEMYNTLENTIIDEYDLDYERSHKIISHCITDLEDAFHLNGSGDVEEMRNIYKDAVENIESKENDLGYDFVTCDKCDSRQINHTLLNNQFDVENNAYGTLLQIRSRLKNIIQDHEAFETDIEIDTESSRCFIPVLRMRFSNIQENYRTSEIWLRTIQELKAKIRQKLRNTARTKEDYKEWLSDYQYNATGLAKLCKNGIDDAVTIIYEKRANYSEADLADLCQYIETCRLLETRILAFDVTGVPSGAYSDLFVNKACEQLMWKIELPWCNKSKYEYAALLFAMLDLGIALKYKRSSTQFAAFVNRKFKESVTADDIRKSRSKLINESFGSMTDEQLEERFDDTQREVLKNKYKEYYDILNSTLNGEAKCDDNTKWLISVINGDVADF